MMIGSPLGMSDETKNNVYDYFVYQHPEQQTPAGVIAYAAQYDFTIAEIGAIFGFSPEYSAQWTGVSLAAATDKAGVQAQINSEIAQQQVTEDVNTIAYMQAHPDYYKSPSDLITALTAQIVTESAQAASFDTVSDTSAYTQVQNTADLSQAQIVAAYFNAHPGEHTPAGVRDYMTRTSTSIDSMAASQGISVAQFTIWLYQDLPPVEKAAAISTAALTQTGNEHDILAQNIATPPAVIPAKTAATLTDTILKYFKDNPSKGNPAGVKEFMTTTGITLADIAKAAGVSTAEADKWLIDGKTITPINQINWALVIPIALAALEFIK